MLFERKKLDTRKSVYIFYFEKNIEVKLPGTDIVYEETKCTYSAIEKYISEYVKYSNDNDISTILDVNSVMSPNDMSFIKSLVCKYRIDELKLNIKLSTEFNRVDNFRAYMTREHGLIFDMDDEHQRAKLRRLYSNSPKQISLYQERIKELSKSGTLTEVPSNLKLPFL